MLLQILGCIIILTIVITLYRVFSLGVDRNVGVGMGEKYMDQMGLSDRKEDDI